MLKTRPKFSWLHLVIFIVIIEAVGSLVTSKAFTTA